MEPPVSELLPVSFDPNPVIEAYKKDVDRTLLRENLKLTTTERVRKMIAALRFAEMVRQSRVTLATLAGDLDLRGEATGGGTYEALLPRSEVRDQSGLECRFVDLPALIHLKRAADRPKDLERIAELEALHQERP